MQSKDIYLIGVGRYTEVIMELAVTCGYIVKGLYHYNDQRTGEFVDGVEILGTTNDLLSSNDVGRRNFALTMGDNFLRISLSEKVRKLGGLTPNLIHPDVDVSPTATIGQGCLLHKGALLWTKAVLGNDCVLGPGAQISHHAKVDDGCLITSYCIVGAYCEVSKGVFMGLNSVLIPNIKIGSYCVIGSKANVVKSSASKNVLAGNPARVIKKKQE